MATNILTEWPSDLRPSSLIDGRDKVKRHPRLKWGKRKISDIEGLCIHQILGGDNPVNTSAYHVNHFPNNTKKPGAPSVAYTFYIRRSGEIWWCNDVEAKTWSQGTGKIPGDENKKYLSIVVGGHFNGPGYTRGKNEPTMEQFISLLSLIKWLCSVLDLGYDQIYGHYDFGKAACPGHTLGGIIEALNRDPSLKAASWSDYDWQYALVRLGYDLGDYGKRLDGVDGDWGSSSKTALTLFQKAQKLTYISGIQDKKTKQLLISALKDKFGSDIVLVWS